LRAAITRDVVAKLPLVLIYSICGWLGLFAQSQAASPSDVHTPPCSSWEGQSAVSANGQVIALACSAFSSGSDPAFGLGTAFVLDAVSAKPLAQVQLSGDPTVVGLSADGRRLAVAERAPNASVGSVAVWDVGDTSRRIVFSVASADLTNLILSPDGGHLLMSGAEDLLVATSQGAAPTPLPAGYRAIERPFTSDNRTLIMWRDGPQPVAAALDVQTRQVLWTRKLIGAFWGGRLTADGLLFGEFADGPNPDAPTASQLVDPRTGKAVKALTAFMSFADMMSGARSSGGKAAVELAEGANDSSRSLRVLTEPGPAPITYIVPNSPKWLALTAGGDVVALGSYGLHFFGAGKALAYLPGLPEYSDLPSTPHATNPFVTPDRTRLIVSEHLNNDVIRIIDTASRREIACWEWTVTRGDCVRNQAQGAFDEARYQGQPQDIVDTAAALIALLNPKSTYSADVAARTTALLAEGGALVELNRFEDARQALAQALPDVDGGQRVQALTAVGESYAREDNLTDAAKVLDNAVEQSEAIIAKLTADGHGRFETFGPNESAAADLNAIAVVDEAEVLIKLSRADKAIQRLQRALGRVDDEALIESRLLTALGDALEAKRDFFGAEGARLRSIKDLDQIKRNQPLALGAATAGYGANLILQGRAQDGEAQLLQALAIDKSAGLPETADAVLATRVQIGRVLLDALDRPMDALDDLRVARASLAQAISGQVADDTEALTQLDRNREVFRLNVEAAWRAAHLQKAPATAVAAVPAAQPNKPSPVRRLDFAVMLADGKVAATSSGNEIVWDGETGRAAVTGRIGFLAPAGGLMYQVGGFDSDQVVDAETGAPISVIAAKFSLFARPASFSQTGGEVLTIGLPNTDMAIVSTKTGQIDATLPAAVEGQFFSRWVAVSPDGQKAAQLKMPMALDMLHPVYELCLLSLHPVKRLRCKTVQLSKPPIVFSPDGKTFLIADNDNNLLDEYDAKTLDLVRTLPGQRAAVTSISFSPDGSKILTTSNDWTAQIIDASSRAVIPLIGHQAAVNGGSFSADGRTVVTASDDGSVILWDARDGTKRQVLR